MCFFKKKNKYAEAILHNQLSEGVRPTEEQLLASPRYKRVLILGVDGAGDYFSKCSAPNFHKMFESGAVSYTALSQFPTISAQNWASILHGVRYQTHKVTNASAAANSYKDDRYPSVFKAYAERHPDAKFASVVNWFPINHGIVENGISGMKKINCREASLTDKEVDDKVLQETLAYLETEDPSIFFLHFDNPDHMGHAFGYGTAEYKQGVEIVDGYLGQIYDLCERKGMLDDTLFIVVSDHGHVLPRKRKGKIGGGHGGWTESERFVTIAVGGKKGIIPGTMGKASTPDIASICFYALGEKQPDGWESAVPYHIFTALE